MLAWAQDARQAPANDRPASIDAVIERSWLDDPDSSLSPQAALAGTWKRYDRPLARGYTASTTWVRLKIDPAAARPASIASDHRLVLTIAPGHLDEVAVFRAHDLVQPPVLVGDKHPAAGPQQGLLNHAVVIDSVTEPLELLLRLRTASNHSMHAEALRWDDASAQLSRHQSLIAGYLVFTVVAIIWAGFSWLQHRQLVAGLFVALQTSALLLALTLLGVLRLYGPPAMHPFLNTLTSLAIMLSATVTILFHRAVLSELGVGRVGVRWLSVMAGVPLMALGAMALGEVRWGLLLTQLSVICSLVLSTLLAFTVPLRDEFGWRTAFWQRAYVIAMYGVMTALLFPQSLRVLGLLSLDSWSYMAFPAYSVLSALLQGGLLLLLEHDARLRRRWETLALAQTQREAAAQRARATEQAELMTMLTHELKTPLSVVSLALGRAGEHPTMRERAMRAVGNMRDVIDRCAQASRMDDEIGRHDAAPSIQPVDLQEVLARAAAAQLHAERLSLPQLTQAPRCQADPQMLAVVVTNLLDNALRYSPSDSQVRATITPQAMGSRPGLALRVINKVGVAGRPDAALAFEKYHRGAHARHRSGSGLGLYLARRLAYRMAGELSLAVAAEDEVCFELWMPC